MTQLYNCRICFDESDVRKDFIVPCDCKGTNKYVHKDCLNLWLKTLGSGNNYDVCKSCLGKYDRKTENNESQILKNIKSTINCEITQYIIMFLLFFIIIGVLVNYFPIIGYTIIGIFYFLLYVTCILYTNTILIFIGVIILFNYFNSQKNNRIKEKSFFILMIAFITTSFLFSEYYYDERYKELKLNYVLSTSHLMYDKELGVYVEGVL